MNKKLMKRTYKVIGYRCDMKDKNKVDHLLILLRIAWENKEQLYKNKKFSKAFSYKRDYLNLVKQLRKFGINIKEEIEHGKSSNRKYI